MAGSDFEFLFAYPLSDVTFNHTRLQESDRKLISRDFVSVALLFLIVKPLTGFFGVFMFKNENKGEGGAVVKLNICSCFPFLWFNTCFIGDNSPSQILIKM